MRYRIFLLYFKDNNLFYVNVYVDLLYRLDRFRGCVLIDKFMKNCLRITIQFVMKSRIQEKSIY